MKTKPARKTLEDQAKQVAKVYEQLAKENEPRGWVVITRDQPNDVTHFHYILAGRVRKIRPGRVWADGVLIDFAGTVTRIAPEDVAHFQIKNLSPCKGPKVKHQTKKGQTV